MKVWLSRGGGRGESYAVGWVAVERRFTRIDGQRRAETGNDGERRGTTGNDGQECPSYGRCHLIGICQSASDYWRCPTKRLRGSVALPVELGCPFLRLWQVGNVKFVRRGLTGWHGNRVLCGQIEFYLTSCHS